MRAVAGPTKHSERAHYGNALLLRLPLRTVRPLDLTIGHREPRGAVDAEILAGDQTLRVIVAHLGLDPWERRAQITRILARIAETPELPTILMGDLNEWTPRSPRLRQLEHGFAAWAAPRSFPARLPALRLDRIFVTAGLALGPAEAVRNPLTRRASDHLPVRATVTATAGADSTPAGSAG